MQMPSQNVKLRSSGHLAVAVAADKGSVDCVANRIFTAVCPVEDLSI